MAHWRTHQKAQLVRNAQLITMAIIIAAIVVFIAMSAQYVA